MAEMKIETSGFLNRLYTNAVESACTRILYFFNTLDSYFIIAGALVWALAKGFVPPSIDVITAAVLGALLIRLSDLYPVFIAASIPAWTALFCCYPVASLGWILLLNALVFVAVLYLFIGIPNSIISRDPRVGFIMAFNSLFTVAPTVVSFSMSFFFSSAYALMLWAAPRPLSAPGAVFWSLIALAAAASSLSRPRPYRSRFGRWPAEGGHFRRVVLLNIDGCSLKAFKRGDIPNMRGLERTGISFRNGLISVYRALTNPAFSSILTSATPKEHGVRNNNFGQSIRVEALPDYVPAILYGSMHVQHFSKPHWETRIVSLPRHSIHGTDDVVFDRLREDMAGRPEVRLFIVDLSEMDFLGHCYGSYSRAYLDALRRTDARIGGFIAWCAERGLLDDTAVIVSSDHGLTCIDHSYLLFHSETYVPFVLYGRGIERGERMRIDSIMDVGNTIAHLLGVRYAERACGKALVDLPHDGTKRGQLGYIARSLYYADEGRSRGLLPPGLLDAISASLGGLDEVGVGIVDYAGLAGALIPSLRRGIPAASTVHCYSPLGADGWRDCPVPRESLFPLPRRGEALSGGPYDLVVLCGAPHEGAGDVARGMEAGLKQGGVFALIQGANPLYFDSARIRWFSRLLRGAGFVARVPRDVCRAANDDLSRRFGREVRLRPEEWLETADGLSPVDPWDSWRELVYALRAVEKTFPPDGAIVRRCYPSPAIRAMGVCRGWGRDGILNVIARWVINGDNAMAYAVRKKGSAPLRGAAG